MLPTAVVKLQIKINKSNWNERNHLTKCNKVKKNLTLVLNFPKTES